ncbi:hypothetical protein ES703_38951 [subsurface metagenome]
MGRVVSPCWAMIIFLRCCDSFVVSHETCDDYSYPPRRHRAGSRGGIARSSKSVPASCRHLICELLARIPRPLSRDGAWTPLTRSRIDLNPLVNSKPPSPPTWPGSGGAKSVFTLQGGVPSLLRRCTGVAPSLMPLTHLVIAPKTPAYSLFVKGEYEYPDLVSNSLTNLSALFS